MYNLVGSPTIAPDMRIDEILSACAEVGFKRFEVFTDWVQSAFDISQNPETYLASARQFGLSYTSLHLPKVEAGIEETLKRAIQGAEFAQALGVEVVIFKATSPEAYIQTAKQFLDAVEPLGLTTVLTNHCNSPISTLQDYKKVLEGINDSRMKALLEVGHFHAAGVPWLEASTFLGERIALVHIKDMAGTKPVPYGVGDVDFKELFAHLDDRGYNGNVVVELEQIPRTQAIPLLKDAVAHLQAVRANSTRQKEQ